MKALQSLYHLYILSYVSLLTVRIRHRLLKGSAMQLRSDLQSFLTNNGFPLSPSHWSVPKCLLSPSSSFISNLFNSHHNNIETMDCQTLIQNFYSFVDSCKKIIILSHFFVIIWPLFIFKTFPFLISCVKIIHIIRFVCSQTYDFKQKGFDNNEKNNAYIPQYILYCLHGNGNCNHRLLHYAKLQGPVQHLSAGPC